MRNSIHWQLCFLRAACVLAALLTGASSEAADITYETRALTGTDGPLGPGLGAGVEFIQLNPPVLNGAGQTAFGGLLTGTGVTPANPFGLWLEGGGSGLALVTRMGNQAPGAADGVNFSSFFIIMLNGAGQTAFSGTLTGEGVTSANDRGIWATDPNGLLHLIARKGDLFHVSNDPLSPDLRNIADVSLTTGLNDAGQLAFRTSFTDGSAGLFVATISGSSSAPFQITITPASTPDTGIDLAWESRRGKVYDLVTATDPATPLAQWPVHAAYGDIPATGTTTTLTDVPVDAPLVN